MRCGHCDRVIQKTEPAYGCAKQVCDKPKPHAMCTGCHDIGDVARELRLLSRESTRVEWAISKVVR